MRKKAKPQRRVRKRRRNQNGGGLARALALVGRVVGKTLKVAAPKLLSKVAAPVAKAITTANRALHRAIPFPQNARLRYLVKQHIPHPAMLPLPFVPPMVTASALMQKPKALLV